MWGAVDDVVLERVEPGLPDAEGRPQRQVVATTVWRGSVTFLSADEADVASRFAERTTAVARLPLEADARAQDRIVVSGRGPALDGTWEITAVRPTPLHLRVLLRRPTI
jgi:hypothetical protein